MLDQFSRNINYMRISITDRCNLRCRYCMPNGPAPETHDNILRYEEILRICRATVNLGIVNYKVTGGEPLVRKGCASFISELKSLPGVEQVTLTTNGILLAENLDALCRGGLDAVTISMDTLDDEKYRAITGFTKNETGELRRLLAECVDRGLRTKVNTVLLEENRDDILSLAAIAGELPVDVRFIELMPIGYGSKLHCVESDEIVDLLKTRWSDLHPTDEKRGNGPAHYYESDALLGKLGFIDAVSHKFCASCNRVRLTSTGDLKPCLSFASTADLRSLLRDSCSDSELEQVLREVIFRKPHAHRFDEEDMITEHQMMSQIGG